MAVVGITPLLHPLLAARGFYTVDGEHRIFTMPFADATPDTPATTMWQLTFRCDEDEVRRHPPYRIESFRFLSSRHVVATTRLVSCDEDEVRRHPPYPIESLRFYHYILLLKRPHTHTPPLPPTARTHTTHVHSTYTGQASGRVASA